MLSPPTDPELGPSVCPAGWREVTTPDGLSVCDGFPEAGPSDCPAGEAHFPGESGCLPVGGPCPAGDFTDGLPATGVLFVLEGGGGDGTRATPFGTIAEATAVASPGDVIALGRGSYAGEVLLPSGVTLRGACVAGTLLHSDAPPPPGGEGVIGAEAGMPASVRDLTIGPSARPGLWADGAGVDLTAEGVVVDGTYISAILVGEGGRFTGRELVVRDGVANGDGLAGRAISVELGSEAQISRAVFEGNREIAAQAGQGSRLVLEDVHVRDTISQDSDGLWGRALAAQTGSDVEARRCVFERNRDVALSAEGTATHLTLEHVVVRGTAGQAADDRFGRGLNVQAGAQVELRHGLFEGNHDAAFFVGSTGSDLLVEDSLVRDTQPQTADGRSGRGLQVQLVGRATVRRSVFSGNHDTAVGVSEDGAVSLEDIVVRDTEPAADELGRALTVFPTGTLDGSRVLLSGNVVAGAIVAGGSLSLEDVRITDTAPRPSDGIGGRALSVQDGATASIIRGAFERNLESGIFMALADLSLEDVLIRSTQARMSDGLGGRGMNLQEGATLTATRLVIDDNREAGILVSDEGSRVTAEDLLVSNTRGDAIAGLGGRGLVAQLGAAAELRRATFSGNREISVFVGSPGTEVLIEDLRVTDTLERQCAATSCGGRGAGTGAGAFLGSLLTLRRFQILGSALCGVQIATGARVDVTDGEIAESAIGVCVQVEGYDLAAFSAEVRFRDNGTNLDVTTLPVPEPVASDERTPVGS